MNPTLQYAAITFKHKWFVFLAGLRIGCSIWRLITHDLSKFLPSELPHYGRQFFGDCDDPDGFAQCWLKHQNRNDHHWEFWVSRTTSNQQSENLLPMSDGATREMVADWFGASRAYDGKWPDAEWPWLNECFDTIKLHATTRGEVIQLLWRLGIDVHLPGASQ